MPLFEYRCPKCNTEFERLLKHSERDDAQACPNEACDEKQAKKLISRSSFSLKGGGWADDGYSS